MDKILEKTLRIISNHTKDGYSGFDIFKRLLNKAMTGDSTGDPSAIEANSEDVVSEELERTVRELRQLQQSMPRHHDKISDGVKNNDVIANLPIIIAKYQNQEWLIDGNNRINFWSEKGNEDKVIKINRHIIPSQENK